MWLARTILDSTDTKFSTTTASSIGKCCTNLTGFRRTWIDQSSWKKTSVKVSKRRGCRVFRFLWPREWDEPAGDKPSEAEDLTEILLIVLAGGVFLSYKWHHKEESHVQIDKQELRVGWLVSLWRKAGEKLGRRVCQRKKDEMSRERWGFKKDGWSTPLSLRT